VHWCGKDKQRPNEWQWLGGSGVNRKRSSARLFWLSNRVYWGSIDRDTTVLFTPFHPPVIAKSLPAPIFFFPTQPPLTPPIPTARRSFSHHRVPLARAHPPVPEPPPDPQIPRRRVPARVCEPRHLSLWHPRILAGWRAGGALGGFAGRAGVRERGCGRGAGA
jgi:hypothetical protein